jgi:CDP-diacylglycerol---glycerol-3-phosphate 3-phosphatidyltransferase
MQLVISLLFFALWGWGNAFCASHSHKVGSASHSGLMRPAKRGIMSADQKGSAARGDFVSVQCASNPDLSRLSPLELKLRKLELPDKLTYSRVLMIPAFMMTFILGMKEWAIGLYVASCITDFLDGYLARRWKQTTAFGAFLDPVADKLMVTVALVFLCCQLPTWWFATPVSLILMRELGVSALREWMAARGKRATVQVGGLGKWKTALQMISTSLLMYACPSIAEFDLSLSQGMDKPVMFTVGLFTMYLSTILTVVSGMQYLKAAWPELTSKSTN